MNSECLNAVSVIVYSIHVETYGSYLRCNVVQNHYIVCKSIEYVTILILRNKVIFFAQLKIILDAIQYFVFRLAVYTTEILK